MIRNFKHSISLFLLLVFILPSIVKFEHKHELSTICKAKSEKHFHIIQEKCGICNFEFSVFSSGFGNLSILKENPVDNYFNSYTSQYLSKLSQSSFLLRAPPTRLV